MSALPVPAIEGNLGDLGDFGDLGSFGDLGGFGDMSGVSDSLGGKKGGLGSPNGASLSAGDSGFDEKFGSLSDGISGADFSSLSDAFSKEQLSVGEALEGGGELSFDDLKATLDTAGLKEPEELKAPDLESLQLEITQSMKDNASETLKSRTGLNFTDLDTSLFSADKLPDISFESLNVEYAGLLTDLEAQGFGTETQITQFTLREGWSSESMKEFNTMFEGLTNNVSERDLPAAAAELISNNISERNRDKSVSALKESDAYKIASSHLSIGTSISDVKAAADGVKDAKQTKKTKTSSDKTGKGSTGAKDNNKTNVTKSTKSKKKKSK